MNSKFDLRSDCYRSHSGDDMLYYRILEYCWAFIVLTLSTMKVNKLLTL